MKIARIRTNFTVVMLESSAQIIFDRDIPIAYSTPSGMWTRIREPDWRSHANRQRWLNLYLRKMDPDKIKYATHEEMAFTVGRV